MKSLTHLGLVALLSCATVFNSPTSTTQDPERKNKMELGNFSISLSVKDLAASRAFYEKLGFEKIGGEAAQNWLILRNGPAVVGLFQGMFEKNMLTFNPGWDIDSNQLEKFTDVREIQRKLVEQGLKLDAKADESTTGPAHLVVTDPDGNPILIDQHV